MYVYAAVRTVAQRLELDVAAGGVVLDTVDWKDIQVLEPKRSCTDHIAVVPSAIVAVAAGHPGACAWC